jgi:hypothetical protein
MENHRKLKEFCGGFLLAKKFRMANGAGNGNSCIIKLRRYL